MFMQFHGWPAVAKPLVCVCVRPLQMRADMGNNAHSGKTHATASYFIQVPESSQKGPSPQGVYVCVCVCVCVCERELAGLIDLAGDVLKID